MDTIFLARQPIYNRELEVVAYELLYRAGARDRADVVDGDQATGQLLVNTFTDFGLERLVGDVPAFINLTRPYLIGELELPIPPDQVALEVLEDVALDDEQVLAGLRSLSDRGYVIVLDDFDYQPENEPALACADLVKLEVNDTSTEALTRVVRRLREFDLQLLAEKVETDRQFQLCLDLGFDFFQGYYFSRPNLVSGQRHASSKVGLLPLLAKLNDPDADLQELERLIARDQVLVYRLLRCANSAAVSRGPIESLHNALLLLGTRTVRTWIILITLSAVEDKPPELCRIALARARMCELLARESGIANPEACFTAGLLSLLDTLMNQPMAELVQALPLTQAIERALLNREGAIGALLQRVCDYEQGHWQALETDDADGRRYPGAYLEALQWADRIMDVVTQTRDPEALTTVRSRSD
ncbi:EAL and HDOD domain-containing protein [Alkalilimnicola ehrlichii MLHE-1]|uniref:Diguanylate phosphodiesterase n=1 Tax=Alkalilimnicola ehrlichii (strain ATCC BAA-1101 / DSM 17681 / MLHE-1) TaxID=187272 RepID=Q0AA63_ALKEH|nr:HDOD domain-containing protein [Alkalilimnicola ehrlichii]ABI56274.1 diguanylate phosphodiesterase [Alkalilimnicola ehrlichii MLHE-1]